MKKILIVKYLNLNKQNGYSLIEYIIFSLLLIPALMLYLSSLDTFSTLYLQAKYYVKSYDLAKSRMELIINHRKTYGFNNIVDPCLIAPFNNSDLCNIPSEYNITSTISADGLRHKIINVNITGPNNIDINLAYRASYYEF